MTNLLINPLFACIRSQCDKAMISILAVERVLQAQPAVGAGNQFAIDMIKIHN